MLGMSCRPRHPRFDPHLRVSLDYLIHGSGGWGCVSMFYSPWVDLKGPALVSYHGIKKKKIIIIIKNKKFRSIVTVGI